MYYNILNILKYRSVPIVILLLVIFGNFAAAQDKRVIDSLKNELRNSSGKEKVTYLLSLCIQYSDNDKRRSYQYADQALEVALAIGDSAQYVRAGRIKGQLLRLMDNVDSSLIVLNKILPTAERNKFTDDYKRILNALALGYTFKANYDEALKYHFQSLIIREAEGNKSDISIALNNIGLVYYKLDDAEKSLEYYNRALVLKKESDDKNNLDILLINMGLCYNQLKDYRRALDVMNEGLAMCGQNCSKSTQMSGKIGIGYSLIGIGKMAEAGKFLTEAYALSKELGDIREQLECLRALAMIDYSLNDLIKAESTLKEAESMASSSSYNQIQIEIFRQLFDIYNQRKDYEKAALYQKKYIVLKDSIFSRELIRNLATIQTNFEERVNNKTIADQSASLALSKEKLKHQEAESLFYVVVCILVFVLAALMFMLFRLTQRANSLLEVRVERRTRELNDSNEALAKVNGELDNFIYKTSHDIRGPLASLKGICNVAILDVQDEAALAYLQKLDFTAEKLNRILTRLLIINQINHATLNSDVIVWEELLEEILFLERKKGVPKRLKIFYEIEKGFNLKSDKEMLRIVLENLIDNGIKFYSESDRVDPFVKVFVYSVEGMVVIKVIDNGVGINNETKEKIFQMFVRASERSETGGIGLYLSRLATGRIEGRIEVRTTPEKYTEFSVKLPMDLAPVLAERRDQERILEFERIQAIERQRRYSES